MRGTNLTLMYSGLAMMLAFSGKAAAEGCLDQIDPQETKVSAALECVKSELSNRPRTVPSGTIVAWFQSAGKVPEGWAICDGTRGTPDLRGKFLRGVGTFSDTGVDPNATETHTHGASVSRETNVESWSDSDGDDHIPGSHNHQVVLDERSNIPPNFKVVFIMKL
jgi:hypothetical protein